MTSRLETAAYAPMLHFPLMAILFWCSAAIVFFAYAGYWLLLRAIARPIPVHEAAPTPDTAPTVSLLIAARNEEANLARKLANLRQLQYPSSRIEILIVSDGSTDGTAALLQAQPDVTAILLPSSVGKAEALNLALAQATGEILVFLDARQSVDPDAVTHLLAPFADPTVGAVSGELLLEEADGTPAGDALGLYWKIEKSIRQLESRSGSVVGVTGALYAMRRSLARPMPPGLILDDVYMPMQVVRQGRRVLFQPRAIARDRLFVQPGKEFRRKVRTLTGNLQLVRHCPWLLTPANPILFRFLSHKMLRLVVPFLLVSMLLSSALAGGLLFHALFLLQVLFFGLALLGALVPGTRAHRLVAIPNTFVMLNLAAVMAFYNFLARRKVWNEPPPARLHPGQH